MLIKYNFNSAGIYTNEYSLKFQYFYDNISRNPALQELLIFKKRRFVL